MQMLQQIAVPRNYICASLATPSRRQNSKSAPVLLQGLRLFGLGVHSIFISGSVAVLQGAVLARRQAEAESGEAIFSRGENAVELTGAPRNTIGSPAPGYIRYLSAGGQILL